MEKRIPHLNGHTNDHLSIKRLTFKSGRKKIFTGFLNLDLFIRVFFPFFFLPLLFLLLIFPSLLSFFLFFCSNRIPLEDRKLFQNFGKSQQESFSFVLFRGTNTQINFVLTFYRMNFFSFSFSFCHSLSFLHSYSTREKEERCQKCAINGIFFISLPLTEIDSCCPPFAITQLSPI